MTDKTILVRDAAADVAASQTARDLAAPADDISGGASPSFTAASTNPWWKIADFGVFGLWMVIVSFTLGYHEKWADEAQAWLIARDLDLRTIWFHELRYEGSPGLWHSILWIAQHWFHVPYASLGLIGVLCAAAGAAFILWKAPFPRPLSYLLLFSYFIVYQYAVVARSYNLLPLLVFAAAYFYRDRSCPLRMTAVLILLANVAVHGTLLAAALGSCFVLEAFKEWPKLSETVHRRYWLCGAAMLLTFLFLFSILKPTPDVNEFAKSSVAQGPVNYTPLLTVKEVLAYAFLDQPLISALFLFLAAVWCFKRGKLLPYVVPVSLMLILFVAVHGRAQHHGTVFVAAIAGLWIAWPTEQEMQKFSYFDRLSTYAMSGLLACLFCVNIWDAAVAMRNDYLYPYSGSDDAASYLKQVRADKSTIFGYTYGMAAVQAFFDHNILVNIPTTYYHQGQPPHAATIDFRELRAEAPQYVIVFSHAPEAEFKVWDPRLRSVGYGLVHFSDGRVFYKRFVAFASSYFIYRRIGPGPGQAPPQSERGR
jgi:hypothetical protein